MRCLADALIIIHCWKSCRRLAVGGGRRDAAPGSARTSSTLGTAAPGPVVRVLLVLSLPIN